LDPLHRFFYEDLKTIWFYILRFFFYLLSNLKVLEMNYFLERIVKMNHSLAEFGPLRPSQARVGRVVGLDCFAILENSEGLSAKFNERGHVLRVEFVQLRGFSLK
jgi:hypothetical protein